MDLSLSNEEDGFALHIDGLDYEEVYLQLKGPLSESSNQWICFLSIHYEQYLKD